MRERNPHSDAAVAFHGGLEERSKKRGRILGDANDLVCCLPIELDIELGFGPTVAPGRKGLEFSPAARAAGQRGPPDNDAHSRGLPCDVVQLGHRRAGDNDATCHEALAPFVLAREHEHLIVNADRLAAIHRLLRGKGEYLLVRIDDLRLDRERHGAPRSVEHTWTVSLAA